MSVRYILFSALFFLVPCACGEKIFTGDVDCDECYTEKPSGADLEINLTINYKYPQVPVTVYRGDVENNEIIAADTADNTPFYVFVDTDDKYSVKAEYRSDSTTLYIVDGTHLKVLRVSDACDESCYVIENEKLDVKINRIFQ
jgi:hypothetical protein